MARAKSTLRMSIMMEHEVDQILETPSLNVVYDQKIRPILDAVDKMRSAGIGEEIQLPTIVVCGDQSVGKSSVLEQISGIQLPRGTGIVTRCPLEMRLRCAPDTSADLWKGRLEYKDLRGTPVAIDLTSPEQIDEGVRTAQEAMTGDTKGISSEIISLLVEAEHVPNLTLIDLPGIARFTQDGSDVPKQTRALIRGFIERPEVIIIVVVPCYTDIETVETLAMARDVDPKFERTVGVMTFPDMVNPGAEQVVLDTLNNKGPVQLAKGFTVVKCRSQAQLSANQSLGQSLKEELDFFRKHPHYNTLQSQQYGTSNLANKLAIELVDRIKQLLMNIRGSLNERITSTDKELSNLSGELPDTYDGKRRIITTLIADFCHRFERSATGDTRHPTPENELVALARKESHEFGRNVLQFIEVNKNSALYETVCRLIVDQRLAELPGFANIYPIVERLARKEFVDFIVHGAKKMSSNMRISVETVSKNLADEFLGQYPSMMEYVVNTVTQHGIEVYGETQTLIDLLISMENYVWTQDIIYMRTFDEMERLNQIDYKDRPEAVVGFADDNEEVASVRLRNQKEQDKASGKKKKVDKKLRREIKSQFNPMIEDPKKSAAKNGKAERRKDVNAGESSAAGAEQLPAEESAPSKMIKSQGLLEKEAFDIASRWQKKLADGNFSQAESVINALKTYLKIAGFRVMDYVPLLIMQKQMTQLAKDIRIELLMFSPEESELDRLLCEDDEISVKRAQLKEKLDALKSADDVLKAL